ncbi:MAG: heme biosynthesis protein HemY [Mangrovicoccus sp.]
MLWSLIKVLLFVAAVAALIYGVEQLQTQGEGLLVQFAGYEVVLGPLATVIAALAVFVGIWLVIKIIGFVVALLRFVLGDETALTRFFLRNRERRGNRALADAMLALASGDSKLAIQKGHKAQKLLALPELGDLVVAQGAEQMGDKQLAAETYKALLTDDRTRFVAVRGLMRQKLSNGEENTALQLGAKALELKPKNADNANQLFQLQAKNGDWAGARKTLGLQRKYGSAPADMVKRRDAILALCQSKDLREKGALEEAHKAALDANRMLPGFAPAAVEASKAHLDQNHGRKAAAILRTAWATDPMPSLAAAYAAIEPEETPAQRLKRFGELVKQNPDHAESKMLLAELNIAAEDFPGARRALGDLMETDPTTRVMTLMAAIERGEGSDDSTVKAWLAKALSAPRSEQWVCEKDGKPYAEWQAICDLCDGFDTLTWRRPVEAEILPDSSAGMLPLIIGALEKSKEEDAVEDAAVLDSDAEPTESAKA